MKPVCLITGVGPEHGTGAEIARRFSTDYRVAMLARNAENIEGLAAKYDGRAYPCDIGDLDALTATLDRIKAEIDHMKTSETRLTKRIGQRKLLLLNT